MPWKTHFLAGLRTPLSVALLAAVFLIAPLGLVDAAKKETAVSQETLAEHPEILDLHQQVSDQPEDARLLASLGNKYAQQGWDDLAIQAYLGALELDPTLYEAWTNLGTIYNRQENLPAAENAFGNAIALQPRAALAYYNLGTVLDRQDRYDEALVAYKTAITYEPDLLDPAVNPQVVNNQHLTSIRLMSYLETSGSGALPLEEFHLEMAAMVDEMDAAEAEEEATPEAAAAIPMAGVVSDSPPADKPVLGTLSADVKKESRRSKRKRQKQEQASAPPESGSSAP
jgi:tetratricopeptide (TPR) repeat protein